MSMTYTEWAARNPQAAQELQHVIAPGLDMPEGGDGKSEAWAQQQVRFDAARKGGMLWRNNVGATPACIKTKCPKCYFPFEIKQQPVRYGLANESHQLNARIKSADLIGVMPVLIMPHHVGTTIGQFMSIEVKKPGWVFNPNDPHQAAQMAWSILANRFGADARFSTGSL